MFFFHAADWIDPLFIQTLRLTRLDLLPADERGPHQQSGWRNILQAENTRHTSAKQKKRKRRVKERAAGGGPSTILIEEVFAEERAQTEGGGLSGGNQQEGRGGVGDLLWLLS